MQKLRTAVIAGSTREGRFGPTIARWAAAQVEQHADLEPDVVDVLVEWRAKPVAFVSYGGLSGGLRAVEHLRPVFAELHAITIRDTVSFHGGRACFDKDGEPLGPESAVAARVLIESLAWWAHTLRDARETRPYPV
ncbi:NADPH-dependent FMN reductase [Actinoplanes sp. NPDC051494]|uniref:NADPH-dependent FMN reductase n=1 Tax=Actinoplanes sp. NPDC051494 TaxID=3363907 RepID=UPI0037977968